MSFSPAHCPICGSVGARALMLDHIETEHAAILPIIRNLYENLRRLGVRDPFEEDEEE